VLIFTTEEPLYYEYRKLYNEARYGMKRPVSFAVHGKLTRVANRSGRQSGAD
jgi:hypothetical protein